MEGEGLEDVMRLSILYSGGRGIGGCDETLQWRGGIGGCVLIVGGRNSSKDNAVRPTLETAVRPTSCVCAYVGEQKISIDRDFTIT